MQYKTYGIDVKKMVVEDHYQSGLGYKSLSKKYNIPDSTIRAWIRKYVNYTNGIYENKLCLENKFLEITKNIKELKNEISNNPDYSITINGYYITTDSQGIKAIMEAIKQ